MHLNILLFNLKADQYVPYAPQIILLPTLPYPWRPISTQKLLLGLYI